MKIRTLAFLCALFLVALSAAAQNGGTASNGNFQFSLTGASGAIQYDARAFGSSARGDMTFTGAAEISNEDIDGEGTSSSSVSNVTLTITFDCLRIVGNRAAMSGVVTASTVPAYIGMHSVLAVEDGGEGSNAGPDRFTWGLYRNTLRTWTPSDAEVPGDNGAMFSWFATDFERPDDVPVQVNGAPQEGIIDCKSFPFGSYAFEAIPQGAGNVQVKP